MTRSFSPGRIPRLSLSDLGMITWNLGEMVTVLISMGKWYDEKHIVQAE
jgi:hypothetical protein